MWLKILVHHFVITIPASHLLRFAKRFILLIRSHFSPMINLRSEMWHVPYHTRVFLVSAVENFMCGGAWLPATDEGLLVTRLPGYSRIRQPDSAISKT